MRAKPQRPFHRPCAAVIIAVLTLVGAGSTGPSRSAEASDPPTDPAPDALGPGTYRMPRQVAWGYGCGGNCAQNTRGTSEVVLTIAADGTATLTDEGTEERTVATPADLTTETRNWRSRWSGAWAADGRFALRAQERACVVETRSAAGSTSSRTECSPPEVLELACAPDSVRIDGGDPAPVWRCGVLAAGDVPWGTELPWCFGRAQTVGVRFVGEPRPESRYVAPWPAGDVGFDVQTAD